MSEGRLRTLRLGDTEIGSLPVRVGDLPIFGNTGFRGVPVVLLGNPAMRNCPVFISYRDNTIRYCREVR